MESPNPVGEVWSKIVNSVIFKIISMLFLVLILLIPASMVSSLIKEREHRKQEAIDEISSKWGNEQGIIGPVLSIPFREHHTDSNNKTTWWSNVAYIMPESLQIKNLISTQKLYRGIYEAVLYNTQIELTGSFADLDLQKLNIGPEDDVQWNRASVLIGISELRGINKPIEAEFNGKSLVMNPGLGSDDIAPIGAGVSSPVSLSESDSNVPFKFSLSLKGSDQLHFVPVGKITNVSAEGDWPNPSFVGDFLPAERTVGPDGFKANWTVLDLNRNFPQAWIGQKYTSAKSNLGIKLYVPVDIYQKSTRTVKYAFLFIVFAFTAFFFSEILNKLMVHPIQYLLIGLAIVLFYSLLLSISEHTNFDIAYWISSVAIIGLITGYAKSILKKGSLALTVGGVLFVLYGYLYIILQLEDYALMMGSIGLFVVLGLVMYLTRKIDWYNIKFER